VQERFQALAPFSPSTFFDIMAFSVLLGAHPPLVNMMASFPSVSPFRGQRQAAPFLLLFSFPAQVELKDVSMGFFFSLLSSLLVGQTPDIPRCYDRRLSFPLVFAQT